MPMLKTFLSAVKKLNNKDLIVFDLDGTLAPSKSPMDKEMSELLKELLKVKKIAVIGGGKYGLFQFQLLVCLKVPTALFHNLFLFPTTATTFYRYKNGWKTVYSHKLSLKEVAKIKSTFNRVFKEIGYEHPKKIYGELIENRGTQVSFSVYGQDIVATLGQKGIRLKEEWKNKHTPTKMKIAKLMQKYLPEFEVRAAGFTTIDVTKKGIDKAYGLHQIEKHIHVPIKRMVFIGDAIFPGGNDYAVTKTGVDNIPVDGPEDTKKIIKEILKVA
ncbi:MAG: HAD-IIB family hydrolase [Candidatus Magasanikbacteria bacterium]|nr:HAD-IIB family hydrolase [Candidatus Magasanikbacteria bacterium]